MVERGRAHVIGPMRKTQQADGADIEKDDFPTGFVRAYAVAGNAHDRHSR